MICEAEENAEADKKARELIDARNSADAQLHSFKKDLEEFGSQITEEQKTEIEDAIKAVEEAVSGNDAERITEELNKAYPAMKALLDKRSEAEAAKQQADAQPEAKVDDNVVDATFTETKESK
jgi:molecular chaperone DnaK